MTIRRPALLVLAVVGSLVFSGCSTESTLTATPTPTASSLEPAGMIGEVISPVGTTWSGTDSAGDLSVFTLQADHTVKVTYGSNTFDEPGDGWAVNAGVLTMHIYIDATNGDLDYTGRYDPTSKTITATGVTTLTSKTVTVTLTEK